MNDWKEELANLAWSDPIAHQMYNMMIVNGDSISTDQLCLIIVRLIKNNIEQQEQLTELHNRVGCL